MIDKPTILITSLGRTGTQFLAKLFADILPGSTSLHEPDIFQGTAPDRWAQYLEQVRRAGAFRMVFQKALGTWTLVRLSDQRFSGRLGPQPAARSLDAQRRAFIEEMPGSVYVEANVGYYGLLDITPQVFREHRLAYLVRDGRDWIRSHMNWGELYGKKGIRKLVSHKWPGARDVVDDPYAERWQQFSRFERLCWAWTRLNEYALATATANSHARVFQFEQLFSSETKYEALDELVQHLTSLPGVDRRSLRATRGWLERPSHRSVDDFPSWRYWNTGQKRHFDGLCAPLMDKLGYTL